MSNRLFTEDVPVAELPCLHCKRIEMGDYGCYNGQSWLAFFQNRMTVSPGICEACGKTPPSLAWKFPKLKKKEQETKKQQPISEEEEEPKVWESWFKKQIIFANIIWNDID